MATKLVESLHADKVQLEQKVAVMGRQLAKSRSACDTANFKVKVWVLPVV